VRVHDDASDEFDISQLKVLFPFAETIHRHDTNLGASGNMHRIFRDALETSCEYILLFDADLIFHPSWISIAGEILPHTDGVLSLFNSMKHPVVGHRMLSNHHVVEKMSLGAAGVIIARRHVEDILKAVPLTRDWDWDWSRYFTANGIIQLALAESAVQHIGLSGEHTNLVDYDFGLNFYPVGDTDTRHTIEVLQELLLMNQSRIEEVNNIWRNSHSFKIGNAMLTPLGKVKEWVKSFSK